jgi:hypothetical protein
MEDAFSRWSVPSSYEKDQLHKLKTRLLVRGGGPRRRTKQFFGKRREEVKSGHGPQRGAQHQDILTEVVK